MNTLRADFLRYAQLHSWYKHIDLSGATFWAYQDIGQQPRNGVHPEVEDLSGLHWWFSRQQPHSSIAATPFEAGPFLRGREGYEGQVAWGLWIIVKDAGEERFTRWIAERYPQWSHISAEKWSRMELSDPIVLELFEKEQHRYYMNFLNTLSS